MSVSINTLRLQTVELLRVLIEIEGRVLDARIDTGPEKSCVSSESFQKYFRFKRFNKVNFKMLSATNEVWRRRGALQLHVEI